jgi:GABA(A) receptor-associated protein
MSEFKKKYPFSCRQNESYTIRLKYPDRIPVICEKSYARDNSVPEIDKKKYLVPMDLTVGQFAYVIRRRIRLPPERCIFLFVNQRIPSCTEQISSLYESFRDADGFLYVSYKGENVFGGSFAHKILALK